MKASAFRMLCFQPRPEFRKVLVWRTRDMGEGHFHTGSMEYSQPRNGSHLGCQARRADSGGKSRNIPCEKYHPDQKSGRRARAVFASLFRRNKNGVRPVDLSNPSDFRRRHEKGGGPETAPHPFIRISFFHRNRSRRGDGSDDVAPEVFRSSRSTPWPAGWPLRRFPCRPKEPESRPRWPRRGRKRRTVP